jgi:ABC-2 type transport system permease protein
MDAQPLPDSALLDEASATLAPRLMGRVNWIGFRTLFFKEVRRFVKVYMQTIAAPVVTTLLFYAVFAVAMGTGGTRPPIGGVPYLQFLAPGLIMMAMTQNAFANTSSSMMISKVQGNIVDLLMTPISPAELGIAFVLGGMARGLLVGLVTAATIACFQPFSITSLGAILVFGTLATMMLSLLGIIGAIWADKFDHIAAVTNFVVAPMTFLSGTFYSVNSFPPMLKSATHFNPFFYMIDGFRYGFIGHADAPLWQGFWVLLAMNAALWVVMLRMLVSGYKLKS